MALPYVAILAAAFLATILLACGIMMLLCLAFPPLIVFGKVIALGLFAFFSAAEIKLAELWWLKQPFDRADMRGRAADLFFRNIHPSRNPRRPPGDA